MSLQVLAQNAVAFRVGQSGGGNGGPVERCLGSSAHAVELDDPIWLAVSGPQNELGFARRKEIVLVEVVILAVWSVAVEKT